MTNRRQTWTEWAKEMEGNVGAWNSLFAVLGTAGLNTVAVAISPSNIMRAYMAMGALLGSFIGYGRTSLGWYGVAKGKRNKLCFLDLVIFLLCVGCGGFVLWIIDPDIAQKYGWAEQVREWLIDPSLVVDLIMAFLSFVGSYFLVAAICIISPRMNRRTGTSNQEQ